MSKRMRVERRKNESADIFALRAFVMAMPEMDENQVWAAAQWIISVSESERMRRKEGEAEIAFGRAAQSESPDTATVANV